MYSELRSLHHPLSVSGLSYEAPYSFGHWPLFSRRDSHWTLFLEPTFSPLNKVEYSLQVGYIHITLFYQNRSWDVKFIFWKVGNIPKYIMIGLLCYFIFCHFIELKLNIFRCIHYNNSKNIPYLGIGTKSISFQENHLATRLQRFAPVGTIYFFASRGPIPDKVWSCLKRVSHVNLMYIRK